MQRKDIEAGKDYAESGNKDLFSTWRTVNRVRIVSTDLFIETSSIVGPITYLVDDEAFVACDVAWCLTQAYPDKASKEEVRLARYNVQVEQRAASERYFRADPMRAFRKVEKTSHYSETGILGRTVLEDKDGNETLGPVKLVQPREVRMDWTAYLVEWNERKEASQRAAERSRNYQNQLEARAKELAGRIAALEDDSVIEHSYVDISVYRNEVKMSHDMLDSLLTALEAATKGVAV